MKLSSWSFVDAANAAAVKVSVAATLCPSCVADCFSRAEDGTFKPWHPQNKANRLVLQANVTAIDHFASCYAVTQCTQTLPVDPRFSQRMSMREVLANCLFLCAAHECEACCWLLNAHSSSFSTREQQEHHSL